VETENLQGDIFRFHTVDFCRKMFSVSTLLTFSETFTAGKEVSEVSKNSIQQSAVSPEQTGNFVVPSEARDLLLTPLSFLNSESRCLLA
jgi:hypothetical protein